MPKQPVNWPTGALPRLMDLGQAAFYCGVSPNTFLDRVEKKLYPAALKDEGRSVWDRQALDDAIDRRFGNAAPSPTPIPLSDAEALREKIRGRQIALCDEQARKAG